MSKWSLLMYKWSNFNEFCQLIDIFTTAFNMFLSCVIEKVSLYNTQRHPPDY